MMSIAELITAFISIILIFYGILFLVIGAWADADRYYRYAKYCFLALPVFLISFFFLTGMRG